MKPSCTCLRSSISQRTVCLRVRSRGREAFRRGGIRTLRVADTALPLRKNDLTLCIDRDVGIHNFDDLILVGR
jgi:hypothetical protein